MSRLFLLSALLLSVNFAQACVDKVDRAFRVAMLPTANITYQQADAYLTAGQFKELDKLLGQLRATETFSPAGTPKLKLFYDAVSMAHGCPGPIPSDSEFAAQLPLLKKWQAHSPRSTGPRIALARYFMYQAWRSRGTEYGYKLTDAQRDGFDHFAAVAAEQIASIKDEAGRDAGWYVDMLDIGVAQHAPPAEFAALFRRGFKRFPQHWDIALAAAPYYESRWYGSPSHYQAFANTALEIARPLTGDRLYVSLFREKLNASALAKGEVDWKRLKTGFEQQLRQFPTDKTWNHFARAACTADDEATLHKLLSGHEDKIKGEFWDAKYLEYCKARQFGPVDCFTRQDTGAVFCEPKQARPDAPRDVQTPTAAPPKKA